MGRAWRIEFEGALYHVLSRGNERREIFFGDDDRRLFMDTVGDMADRFEIELYAYVLMNNHYHLLFRTRRANLSRAMQWFGVTYTNRFNARNSRSGHLFQGRFKCMLVENDAYLMRLSLYIHRNPLRAGIVTRLVDHRWSSYGAYGYGEKRPAWLKTDLLLAQFRNSQDRHVAYREELQRYSEEEKRIWEDLRHGFILGTKKFVETIRERYLPETPDRDIPQQMHLVKDLDLERILKRALRFLGWDEAGFKSNARVSPNRVLDRDLLLFMIWQLGVRTNSQIGEMFGLTASAVSRRVRVMKPRVEKDHSLQKKMADLKSLIEV
jgi:putative transposase